MANVVNSFSMAGYSRRFVALSISDATMIVKDYKDLIQYNLQCASNDEADKMYYWTDAQWLQWLKSVVVSVSE